MSKNKYSVGRRHILQAGAASAITIIFPSFAQTSDNKIQIGY